MAGIGGGGKKGKRYSMIDYENITIWCRPSEWDKLNYLSAGSNKTLSAWVIDELMKFDGVPTPIEHPDEVGKVKPLHVPVDKWNVVKERAEKAEMSISNYVLSVLLSN